VGGLLLGMLVGPDLDVDHGNVSYFYMRRIGALLGLAWRLLWWPYSKMAKHRGLSHYPLIGTATRVWYIWVIAWLLSMVLHFKLPAPDAHFWHAFAGLVVADLGHIAADWSNSGE